MLAPSQLIVQLVDCIICFDPNFLYQWVTFADFGLLDEACKVLRFYLAQHECSWLAAEWLFLLLRPLPLLLDVEV